MLREALALERSTGRRAKKEALARKVTIAEVRRTEGAEQSEAAGHDAPEGAAPPAVAEKTDGKNTPDNCEPGMKRSRCVIAVPEGKTLVALYRSLGVCSWYGRWSQDCRSHGRSYHGEHRHSSLKSCVECR